MRATGNRETLLERGLEIIHERGFNATGVQELADAAGVPKGSFYNHFASKDAFGVAVLERYTETSLVYLEQKLGQGGAPHLDRLRSVFDEWIELSEGSGNLRGCLIGNLSLEKASSSPELRIALDAAFRRVEAVFARSIGQAAAAGELAPKAPPETLASLLYSSWQGALMRAKASQSTQPLHEFREIALPGILGR